MKGFARFIRKLDGLPEIPESGKWSYPEDCPDWVDIEVCEEFIVRPRSCLIDQLFEWKTTPQGGDYWELRCEDLEPVTQEDIDYIQWVIDHAQ